MRLEAVCSTCRRRFLLTEILPPPEGSGGRCPNCGARFGRHYVAALPALIRDVEANADAFTLSFNRLADMHTGFELNAEEFLKRVAAALEFGEQRHDESA
jgi:DNA-directed RNA polymerase subunit RPC12/RpoP